MNFPISSMILPVVSSDRWNLRIFCRADLASIFSTISCFQGSGTMT
ncbi:hypothetical protein ACHAXS_008642 [Conticribra weissflogii]